MSFPKPEEFFSPKPRRVRKGETTDMTPDQERRLQKLTGTVEKISSVVAALVARRQRAAAMLAASKAEVNFICGSCEKTFSEQEAERLGGECPDCDAWLVKTPAREARPGELGHDDTPRPRGRQDQTMTDEDPRPRDGDADDDGILDEDDKDDTLAEDEMPPDEAEQRGISTPRAREQNARRRGRIDGRPIAPRRGSSGGRLDGQRLTPSARRRGGRLM